MAGQKTKRLSLAGKMPIVLFFRKKGAIKGGGEKTED
jgi:hypothetical protein